MSSSDQTAPHSGLGVLDIELSDGLGSFIVDPNRCAIMGHKKALPLASPHLTSDLSGKPAYGYRTHAISLALTEEELLRLLRRDLRPEEVQILHEKFGVFHEIHEDFYDLRSYESLQPMDE